MRFRDRIDNILWRLLSFRGRMRIACRFMEDGARGASLDHDESPWIQQDPDRPATYSDASTFDFGEWRQ